MNPQSDTNEDSPKEYNLDQEFPKQYLDPDYWNPPNERFELINWEKFLSKNPSPPKVYDPPQKHAFFDKWYCVPLWWWNRCWLCKPLHRIVPGSKKTRSRISKDKDTLVKDLLGPSPNSQHIPEALRNKLFWTEDNIVPETLLSFNRWAWGSQVEGGRVIGLGNIRYDWTVDNSCFGALFGLGMENYMINVQAAPDGKWLALYSMMMKPDKPGRFLYMYVVQEEDEFRTPTAEMIDRL